MAKIIDYSKFTEVPYEEKPAIIKTTIKIPNIEIPSNEMTLFEQVCKKFPEYEPKEMTLIDLISNEFSSNNSQECYDICLDIKNYNQIPYINVLPDNILKDFLNGNNILFFSVYKSQGFIYVINYKTNDIKNYDFLIKWENPSEFKEDEGTIALFVKNNKICFYFFNFLRKKEGNFENTIFKTYETNVLVYDLNSKLTNQSKITSGFIFEDIFLDYYTDGYIYNFLKINKEDAFKIINDLFKNNYKNSKDLITIKGPIIKVEKPSISKNVNNMNFLLCSDNFDSQNCTINYKVYNLTPGKSYRLYFDIGSFASIDYISDYEHQNDYVQISINNSIEKYSFKSNAYNCDKRYIYDSKNNKYNSTYIGKTLPDQNEEWAKCGYINHLFIDFTATDTIENGFIKLIANQEYYDEAWALLDNGWKIEEIGKTENTINPEDISKCDDIKNLPEDIKSTLTKGQNGRKYRVIIDVSKYKLTRQKDLDAGKVPYDGRIRICLNKFSNYVKKGVNNHIIYFMSPDVWDQGGNCTGNKRKGSYVAMSGNYANCYCCSNTTVYDNENIIIDFDEWITDLNYKDIENENETLIVKVKGNSDKIINEIDNKEFNNSGIIINSEYKFSPNLNTNYVKDSHSKDYIEIPKDYLSGNFKVEFLLYINSNKGLKPKEILGSVFSNYNCTYQNSLIMELDLQSDGKYTLYSQIGIRSSSLRKYSELKIENLEENIWYKVIYKIDRNNNKAYLLIGEYHSSEDVQLYNIKYKYETNDIISQVKLYPNPLIFGWIDNCSDSNTITPDVFIENFKIYKF